MPYVTTHRQSCAFYCLLVTCAAPASLRGIGRAAGSFLTNLGLRNSSFVLLNIFKYALERDVRRWNRAHQCTRAHRTHLPCCRVRPASFDTANTVVRGPYPASKRGQLSEQTKHDNCSSRGRKGKRNSTRSARDAFQLSVSQAQRTCAPA